MVDKKVVAFLKKNKIKFRIESDKIYIDGDCNLSDVHEIPENFNPIIKGHLLLLSLESIPKGCSFTVGGKLGLHSLKSIPAGWNPTVGGDLYLWGLKELDKNWRPYNVKGTIKVTEHLRNIRDYCVEMALLDKELDWIPRI